MCWLAGNGGSVRPSSVAAKILQSLDFNLKFFKFQTQDGRARNASKWVLLSGKDFYDF